MSLPHIVAIAPESPAARAGLQEGDQIVTINGEAPRDLIEWRLLVDEPRLSMEARRGGLEIQVDVDKGPGEPLGAEVQSALFDRVRTCDNHCEFCFIYQLPPGLRRSLYLKDDDYRLSFLYGNFTTLTRFTEADLERIVTEGLSPLYVSIHATDPDVRSQMLRNRRGATSLRWLRALLDHDVEVHGQVVLCPSVNDGPILEDTLVGVLDRYPELATLCIVPLGVSRYNTEPRMRTHTRAEAEAVLDSVHEWQQVFRSVLGRRLVYAADEYYLLAGRPFPSADAYEDFAMHEDGVGMARAFEAELFGEPAVAPVEDGAAAGPPKENRGKSFQWADSGEAEHRRQRVPVSVGSAGAGVAPCSITEYEPYRAPRTLTNLEPRWPSGGHGGSGYGSTDGLRIGPSRRAPVAVLTAPYGAQVLEPLLDRLGRADTRLVVVENQFFGGNVAVTGLMVGEDLSRALAAEPAGHRYLLPDVCLTQGRFLDGSVPADLPHPVEIVPASGTGLREALGLSLEAA